MGNELYNAIFKRKSVRKYDLTPLSDEKMNRVQEYARGIKPLDESIHYEISYLETDKVKSIMPIKAPHYICLYSEKKDKYLLNAGFLLQQIDLFLSANDLGSCWLGMAKPSKDVPELKNGMEFIVMIAFGNATEPVHRQNISEFKRNSISDITSIKEADQLLEPVRIAPSAGNSQPWYFSGDAKEIIVSRKKLNIIKAQLYGRMNQIDIGIALFHLWLSIEHQGKKAGFDFKAIEGVPNGGEFMVKVLIGE